MKRKLFITLFALSIILSLAGCGKKDNSGGMDNNSERQYASEEMLNQDLHANESTSSDTKISHEEAKKIALGEAGVTENDIHDYEIELDRDFGVLVYEIEFNSNGTEYKYEVNADSGEITKRKMDID